MKILRDLESNAVVARRPGTHKNHDTRYYHASHRSIPEVEEEEEEKGGEGGGPGIEEITTRQKPTSVFLLSCCYVEFSCYLDYLYVFSYSIFFSTFL